MTLAQIIPLLVDSIYFHPINTGPFPAVVPAPKPRRSPPPVLSAPGPVFTPAQLVFAGCASLVLYGSFVWFQTVRHRDYFLPPDGAGNEEAHAPPPSATVALVSLALLVASLVAVVGLAKALSPALEARVARVGAPKAVVGILIAALVLLP